MKRLEPEIIDYYNVEVLEMISEKYGMTPMDALRAFVFTETHEMLENAFEDINSLVATEKHAW